MHLTGRKVVEYIPSQFFVLMRDAAFPAPWIAASREACWTPIWHADTRTSSGMF
jgi:hypothetical protein